MSSKKKGGVQEGPLVKMLERQRVQQAAVDAAKKLADAGVGAWLGAGEENLMLTCMKFLSRMTVFASSSLTWSS
jgi:hypothetical protein